MVAIMSEALAATTATPGTAASADDELSRVDGLVERLASAFEAGLDFYNTWLQRQQAENSYHRHHHTSPAEQVRPLIKCAISTSLDMSSYRIQSTYQIAYTLIGPDFAAGDDQTRQTLTTALHHLQPKIESLSQIITYSLHQQQPLPLHELYLCSEQVRLQSVTALAQQYRRMAAGRLPPLPQTLPVPRPKRMSALLDELDEADSRFSSSERPTKSSLTGSSLGACCGDSDGTTTTDAIERVDTAGSEVPDPGLAALRSNPPSPPLTPKVRPGSPVLECGRGLMSG